MSRLFAVPLFVVAVAVPCLDSAQTSAPLTDAQKARLKERDRVGKDVEKLRGQGKLVEAIAAAEKMLAIEIEIFGKEHQEIAGTLQILASLHDLREDFAAAKKIRLELVPLLTKLFGKEHWSVIDTRVALRHGDLLAKLGADARRHLRDAERLDDEARALEKQRKLRDALTAYGKALAIRKQVLGGKDVHCAPNLAEIGLLQAALRDPAAETSLRQALELYKAGLGDKHPTYGRTLFDTARYYHNRGAFAKAAPLYEQALDISRAVYGAKAPEPATYMSEFGLLYLDLAQYAKAEVMLREATEIYKHTFGDKHPRYATVVANLGLLYEQMGEFAKAEPFMLEALAIRKEVLGESHLSYSNSLHNLGLLYSSMGAYGKAEPYYLQALALRKKLLGDKHTTYANTVGVLASMYRLMGDFDKAEPLQHAALAIRKQALGEKHPAYAVSLSNLGALYRDMGEFVKAESTYLQVIAIRKEILGEKHPDYANSLARLGLLYKTMGDHVRAESLLAQALALRKAMLGEKHPDYATSLHDLGELYRKTGDNTKALSLLRQAQALQKQVLGEKHPEYAATIQKLAVLERDTGAWEQAEKRFLQVVAILRHAFGDKHNNYGTALFDLATLHRMTGEHAKAERLFREALAVYTHNNQFSSAATAQTELAIVLALGAKTAAALPLVEKALVDNQRYFERTATGVSERKQLLFRGLARGSFNAYATFTAELNVEPDKVYSHVLYWKSPVTVRQYALRRWRQKLEEDGNQKLLGLYADLEHATRLLAARSNAVPNPKNPVSLTNELQELSDEVERLQAKLVAASGEFRHELERHARTLDDIRNVLPNDAVLVDFLEYAGLPQPGVKGNQYPMHLAAFVVRKGKPVERIELGRLEPISKMIDAWRDSYGAVRGGMNPGADLRKLLWTPLEKHIKDARIVLIAPGGALANFPFAALPGSKKGTFLIEEKAVAVVPVPQLLPQLLAEISCKKSPQESKDLSLLVVGGVDFDASPGKREGKGIVGVAAEALRGGERTKWRPLPGTQGEFKSIQSLFGKRFPKGQLTALSGVQAKEAEVRRLAPKARYLHFATHGYFAPPELRAQQTGTHAVDYVGMHPGLLSGLVLAGANRPIDADLDDGILTALEVEALNMSGVELVVLSACETGLGKTAGGEGMLGLQRAFQIAGAKSVVSSLWQVPDRATQALMERFYANLWDKKMSKLEALREAQLWLLREGRRQPELLRGIDVIPDNGDDGRLPARFWAAFVLSGNWN